MGHHFALLQVRASARATQTTVCETIGRFWQARGAHPDPRNPLRLRPLRTSHTGRIGYAVSESTPSKASGDWILVAESERHCMTAGLAAYLHGELETEICEYQVEDAADVASLRCFGGGAGPLRGSARVLEAASEFWFGGLYYDQVLDLQLDQRRRFITLGLQGVAVARAPELPEQAIWRWLEAGDAAGLATALTAVPTAVSVAALARLDLGAAAERAAIAALPTAVLAGLPSEILVTLVTRCARVDDRELLQRLVHQVARTPANAHAILMAGAADPHQQLVMIELFGAALPELAATLATRTVALHIEMLDLATVEAWDHRTAGVADANPELHHDWAGAWARRGDLERAADHAIRAVACGYDRSQLRARGPTGGVVDQLHKQLTRLPRYRELFKPVQEPEPAATPRVRRAVHPTFGEGVIVREAGDALEIAFEQVGTKLLKRRFVRVIE